MHTFLPQLLVFHNPVNLAKGKETKQSSISYDGQPERAVDGDTQVFF